MDDKTPIPLQELKKVVKPIRNLNLEYREKLNVLDKIAIFVTEKVGSMGFFFIIFLWTIVWLGWNMTGPSESRFDPYPAFVLWLFISNVFQLFLLPLLLIGQNLQGRHSEVRAEIDFETNIKSEKEIEAVLKHLEYQNEMIITILQKVEQLEKQEQNNNKKRGARS